MRWFNLKIKERNGNVFILINEYSCKHELYYLEIGSFQFPSAARQISVIQSYRATKLKYLKNTRTNDAMLFEQMQFTKS